MNQFLIPFPIFGAAENREGDHTKRALRYLDCAPLEQIKSEAALIAFRMFSPPFPQQSQFSQQKLRKYQDQTPDIDPRRNFIDA